MTVKLTPHPCFSLVLALASTIGLLSSNQAVWAVSSDSIEATAYEAPLNLGQLQMDQLKTIDTTQLQSQIPSIVPDIVQFNPSETDALPADDGVEVSSDMGVRAQPAPTAATSGQDQSALQIEIEDESTGQPINVDVNSEELTYDASTGKYHLEGDVYIIVPDKDLEILANEAVFDMGSGNLDAFGNVFIFNKNQVTGSTKAHYDLNTQALYQKDFRTKTNEYKLRSDQSERYEHFQVLDKGRIITDASPLTRVQDFQWLFIGSGATFSFYSARYKDLYMSGDINKLYLGTPTADGSMGVGIGAHRKDQSLLIPDKKISPLDVAEADFSDKDDRQYRVKVSTINVKQYDGGIDEVKFTHPRFNVKGVPVGYLPYMKFGHNEEEGVTAFMGPDFGYNLDYGGAYFGPSISRHIGDGFAYISPIVTFGEGRRTGTTGTAPDLLSAQVGAGVLGHYRSKRHMLDGGWNSTLGDFTFLTSSRVFKDSSATRIRGAMNRQYRNGFFGNERPQLIGELTDQRNFSYNEWLLQTYLSGGAVKDEFFPTGRRRFFVAPTTTSPLTTSRFQGQLQFQRVRPFFTIADAIALNVLAQARFAAYGTGDNFGVFRAGPVVTMAKGPVFTQLRYLYTETTGSTPLVFDSFFEGSNNLFMVNALDLGKYVTVGAAHSFNLDRENFRNDLVVGQQFFVSFGPESVKFSVGYDVVQQQSLLGVTINPTGGEAAVDFNQMNIKSPDHNRRDDRIPFSWDTIAPPTKKDKKKNSEESEMEDALPKETKQSDSQPLEEPALRDTNPMREVSVSPPPRTDKDDAEEMAPVMIKEGA